MAAEASPPPPLSPSSVATQAIRAFLADDAAAPLPPQLRAQLEARRLSLLQLIRMLGDALTDDDEARRGRALRLLALVVTELAPAQSAPAEGSAGGSAGVPQLFERQASLTLAGFFAGKLEDAVLIADSLARAHNAAAPPVAGSAPSFRHRRIPVGAEPLAATLEALARLAALDVFGAEAAKDVAESLFAHVTPSLYPQAMRYLIYRLVDVLVARHRNSLKASLGETFLRGYLKLVEGEKDPRNLLYCFATDWVLLREFEMSRELGEAFFDATYCYFPITFRPPPDDPYGISTEQLTLALRRCLVASPVLAPHAMPLLLEKLAAAGGNAKLETLAVLEEALPVFGREAALANESRLWEGLKIEIMHATDDATSLASQRTLVSFMRVLYLGVEPPEGLAPRIVADCLDVLEEPAKVLAPHAATILACLVRAAPSTAYLALYGMLEQMLTYWKNADDVSVRAPILEHIGTLLRALRDAYEGRETWGAAAPSQPAAKAVGFGTASSSTSAVTPTPVSAEGSTAAPKASPAPARSYEIDSRPLEPFRDDLVGALANGLRSTQYRLPALHAFLALARIPGFLEAREIDYLTEGVNELLLAAHGDEVRGPALDGLRELSLRHSHILEATTLPLLFAALPDRMSSSGDAALQEAERSRLRRALSALARLCAQPNLFDTLVVRVVTKLDLACAADYSAPAEREANVGYVRGLLVTLQTLLEDKASERHTDLPRYAVSLPPRLLSLVFAAAVRSSAGAAAVPVAADPRVVADVGSAVTTLVRMLEPAKQQSLVAWLYPLIEAGQQGPLSLGPGLASSEVRFLPLATDAQPAHRAALPAFLAAYVALHKSVPPPRGGDAVQWARELLPWTLAAASRAEETAGCAALAAVFNKSIAEPLQPEAAALLDDFWHSCIEQASADPQRRRIALRIWCWIAKALMTRTSAAAEGMLLRILSLFDTPDLARDAARGLGLIARTDDGVLSKENGAVVRLLHRQRFYSFVLPKIIAGYREAQPAPGAPAAAVQGVYLIALAALLPSMPRQTTRERLSDLFPLLLRALDLPDAGARASAAQTVALAAAVGKKERSDAILAGSVPEGAPKRENMPLDLVESHVSTLIERLLSVATPSEHSPADTRIAALRCLASLARSVTYAVLHPHRVRVQRGLAAPGVGIDDPRRAVRLEAVEARDAWLTLKSDDDAK